MTTTLVHDDDPLIDGMSPRQVRDLRTASQNVVDEIQRTGHISIPFAEAVKRLHDLLNNINRADHDGEDE